MPKYKFRINNVESSKIITMTLKMSKSLEDDIRLYAQAITEDNGAKPEIEILAVKMLQHHLENDKAFQFFKKGQPVAMSI